MDFRSIAATSKDEQIRAWAIEQATELRADILNPEDLIKGARKIEEYVLGKNEGGGE